MITIETVLEFAKYLGGLILGIILTRSFEAIKNRLSILRYSLHISRLGTPRDNPFFKDLSIEVSGQDVRNLYIAQANFVNDTARDYDSFDINVVCDVESMIFVSSARIVDQTHYMSFTTDYANLLEKSPQDPNIFTYRKYFVPSFNRSDQLELTLLITTYADREPVLNIGTNKVGLKLKAAPNIPLILGEPAIKVIILGFTSSLLLVLISYYLISSSIIGLLVGYLFGIFSGLLGIGVRKVLKILLRLIS
ncbi:hypothetical protein [Leptospira stimsonii]|uniref:Uncharacterized protein n=1 Tax=Leptospira stimsonii TaxID=2202203 RepID=A0ABY2N4Y9_9LEPT|nr:hypothetical protein [Leptospira stimsonii]TGK24955.1 hypothetical protein EHO98_03140 [Leptospira stimsonii]TGM17175.1 hypothetical protein EHQ90_08150 [Leptospira stimsonii]